MIVVPAQPTCPNIWRLTPLSLTGTNLLSVAPWRSHLAGSAFLQKRPRGQAGVLVCSPVLFPVDGPTGGLLTDLYALCNTSDQNISVCKRGTPCLAPNHTKLSKCFLHGTVGWLRRVNGSTGLTTNGWLMFNSELEVRDANLPRSS